MTVTPAAVRAPLPVAPPRRDRAQHWWDRISIYLPVLLMGLLALGSYWLVRQTPPMPEARPVQAPRHEPDYAMWNFVLRDFAADGRLRTELQGREMRHYPDDGTLEVDDARLRTYPEDGQTPAPTTAVAQRLGTNADQTVYTLTGNVTVVRPAERELRFQGEALTLWPQENRLASDQPVRITRGADHITANRLHYDSQRQVAQLDGRVRATLAAQPR